MIKGAEGVKKTRMCEQIITDAHNPQLQYTEADTGNHRFSLTDTYYNRHGYADSVFIISNLDDLHVQKITIKYRYYNNKLIVKETSLTKTGEMTYIDSMIQTDASTIVNKTYRVYKTHQLESVLTRILDKNCHKIKTIFDKYETQNGNTVMTEHYVYNKDSFAQQEKREQEYLANDKKIKIDTVSKDPNGNILILHTTYFYEDDKPLTSQQSFTYTYY